MCLEISQRLRGTRATDKAGRVLAQAAVVRVVDLIDTARDTLSRDHHSRLSDASRRVKAAIQSGSDMGTESSALSDENGN